MYKGKIDFKHVVSKKESKDHIKAIEKNLTEHKTFIDGEVKTLQELRGTFPALRKVQSTVTNEIGSRRTQFTSGRKGIDDKVTSTQSLKGDLEGENDQFSSEVED